ncbi:hypothetical protein [Catenulispora rubra]|uniref:hypothetical protein n=1 Tax=Catenulispora rubra TaxID=280293 RepID=UPI001891FCEF|nr:hypothetical protein [Catenulispora rubra]
MNRIEQVASPTPAQQPLLPRALADVRRRTAHAMVRPGGTTYRARRTSGFAVAIAALAVPLLPSQAFGVASSVDAARAPHVRHHIQLGPYDEHSQVGRHGQVLPGPGAMTLQGWTASGWTLTAPDRPADVGLWGHLLAMHHDGHYVPWLAGPLESADPAYAFHPRPVVLPDGTRGEIAAYRVSQTSPRAADPAAPESQTPAGPAGPADPADSTGPDGSGSSPGGWSQLGGGSADRTSDGLAAVRGARSQVVPAPLIPFSAPANTKQMLGTVRQGADIPDGAANHVPTSGRVMAAAVPSVAPCLRGDYPAGTDRHMVARLHPARDAMNVVVTNRRTPCAAAVDYLSQARA